MPRAEQGPGARERAGPFGVRGRGGALAVPVGWGRAPVGCGGSGARLGARAQAPGWAANSRAASVRSFAVSIARQ